MKRALHFQLMQLLARLGVRVHYVNVGADLKEIVGEEMPPCPKGYETRVVTLEDLMQHAGRVAGLTAEFLEQAFERGDICVANFLGDDLVGFSFSSFTRVRVTAQIDAIVPAGFRYGYKAWTHPGHRKANLSKMRGYVRRKCLPRMHEQRSIHYIETHNYPSLLHGYRHPRERALRMGFSGWVTVFGRQIPFNTRRARWIGFEFVRNHDHRRRQYV